MNFGAEFPLALPGGPVSGATDTRGGGQIGLGHLANVLRRRWPLMAAIIGTTLVITALFLWLQTPIYQATATLRMDIPVSADGSERAIPTAESEMQIETETRTLASHDFARALVLDLELLDVPAFSGRKMSKGRTQRASKSRIDKAAARLLTMVQVHRVPRTQLINVSVESPYPQFAAMVANRYVQVRQMHGAMDRLQRQDGIIAAIAHRTKRAGDELRAAEQAVADYRRTHRMLQGTGGPNDIAGLNQLAAETAAAASLRAAAVAKAAGVSAAARIKPGVETATSPVLTLQQQREAELLQRQAELSAFYGPGHPSLANVMAQLKEVQRNIASERERVRRTATSEAAIMASHESSLARSDAQSAAAREAALRGHLASLTSTAYSNTAANVRLAELERNAETQRALYIGLAGRLKQLGSALISGTGLVLQSTAPVPLHPVRPTPRKTLLVAFLGSGILAFACAFALEMNDRRLRSAEQIWKLFQLPTFAMIPLLRSGVTRMTALDLIVSKPNSKFVDAMRTLYQQIALRRHGPGAQTVLITSPLPGDGKTSVAYNLGAVAVAAGKTVVLVDLDLRRVTDLAGEVQDIIDLAGYLEGEGAAPALPAPDRTSASSALTVFATRKVARDPAATISSPQLIQLFSDLRSRADLIIIDAPPVLSVGDATALLPISDLSLLVARWGRTQSDEVAHALNALREPVAGVVLNAVDYPRHAQGRYGDSVQYFHRSGAYSQHDPELVQPSMFQKFAAECRKAGGVRPWSLFRRT